MELTNLEYVSSGDIVQGSCKIKKTSQVVNNNIVVEIKNVIETARKKVVREVNTQILQAYWQVGRIIVEYEQKSPDRAEYGRQTLKELSKLLTNVNCKPKIP